MVAIVLSRLKGADSAPIPRLGTVSRLAVIGGFVLLPATAAVPSSSTQAAQPAVPPEVLVIDVVGEF